MPVNLFDDYPMSWKPEKKNLSRPIYLSLASQLEEDIRLGYLPPGTKLPPQRELADFLDINFTTVTRAYKACELKGLIYAVTGKGTFVSPYAVPSSTISTNGSAMVYDLGFTASYESTNAMITETAREVTALPYFTDLLNYDSPMGMPHHRTTFLRWMNRFGVKAEVDNTAVVSGSMNGIAVILLSLFSPGDNIAVDRFTFSNFNELAKAHHIHLIPVAGDESGMHPDDLDKQCRLNPVSGIYVMPSCVNPTAVYMPEARRAALSKIIQRHKLILIEDDTYAFLTAGVVDDYEGPLCRYVPDRYVYICAMSKSICSGLRVASIAFSPGLRKNITWGISNINVKTSALDAEIITRLIQNGTARDIIEEKRRLALKSNAIYDSIFPDEAAAPRHPLTFFRWKPIDSSLPGTKIEERFLSRGLRVFHSDRFLIGSSPDKHYLRISLATMDSPKELETALTLLSGVMEEVLSE